MIDVDQNRHLYTTLASDLVLQCVLGMGKSLSFSELSGMSQELLDKNGRVVTVGTRVRVLSIPALDPEMERSEVDRVNSMLGEEFEVYEVDAYGRAWVEKWWYIGTDISTSHSLGLESNDMERINA